MSFTALCDAFDSMSGATAIGASALLLALVCIVDRAVCNRISKN